MADLFRKSSLEKLSSPEQLDKMIVITPPSFWLAMLGAALIVVSALVWSIFGRLPENVETQGIYVNRAGIQSVYCEGNGTVAEIKAQDGDTVKKGDIIAVLDTSDIDEKIAEYEE
ncbi:MAG: biotin/lipoyl-binding protein, partial [Oscillospiraceae bacterium]|nr:biotin/lipoyl-binding protein [Oscillospiraceae bacterium]